jgi:hypothetical protein
MTNELMKDTQQLPVQVRWKKLEFTHFITISPKYKNRKRDHINVKGSSVNAVWKTENSILNLKTLGL